MSTSAVYDLVLLLMSAEVDESRRAAAFQELIEQPVTADCLAEAARALRDRMTPVELSAEAIDTCGTGGSGKRTFNTSTLSAFVIAAAGGRVAKHGNRSASGNCGGCDLLERLGAAIDLGPDQERRIFDSLGIVFLHAARHHAALRRVAPLRKAHGKRTVFNYLGPLCNPANVRTQLMGAGNSEASGLLADCLRRDPTKRAVVATGDDGLDEVTVVTATTIRSIEAGRVTEARFSPESLGLPLFSHRAIEGGTADENAATFLSLAAGRADDAKKTLVLVNAAHGLQLAGVAPSLSDAYGLASETLASGRVLDLLNRYCRLSNELSQ
ncbi:MAG: anthranilate phosphoribosyltransferase [Thermoguttaceae bacterium]